MSGLTCIEICPFFVQSGLQRLAERRGVHHRRDLLELTDPRQVVVVGTRLPEDVENWWDWVMRRKP